MDQVKTGKLIRQLRTQMGITQKELAERINVSDKAVSKWDTGGEWYITTDHEMTKEHHISFIAYQSDSSLMLFKQYPEWGVNIDLPMYRSGRLVWYCNKCGLLYQKLCP